VTGAAGGKWRDSGEYIGGGSVIGLGVIGLWVVVQFEVASLKC
jgi:hypothetical protein